MVHKLRLLLARLYKEHSYIANDSMDNIVAKKKDKVDVTKKNQAFRAVHCALFKYKAYVTGLLTDTNSSVANLAPQLKHDPLVLIESLAI